MNREIKFRGWDEKNKEMVDNINLLFSNRLNDCFEEYEECGLKIMQYTGLKDKNGKKIFEGDILLEKDATIWEKFTKPDGSEWTKMSKNKKDEYYAVYFDNKKAQFTANKHWLWSISKSTEVIGNIHKNPELLKGE